MTTESTRQPTPRRRLLSRIAPENFVGRSDALREINELAAPDAIGRGLFVLSAPCAGASELLRQAYDRLFYQRASASPIFFAWRRNDQTSVEAARRFLHTFLAQLVAHRRNEPSFINAPPPLSDLVNLALPADYEWIERLVESYEHARAGKDERTLIRLCLNAPQLAAARGARSVVMFDDVQHIEHLKGEVELGSEIAHVLMNSDASFVLAGLRRRLFDVLNSGQAPYRFDNFGTLHLEHLSDRNARTLVERLAHSQQVSINDETRDLIVQQFAGNPLEIASLIRAAQQEGISLTSFLECQKLYVDKLLGGYINRRFNSILEEIAPSLTTRRELIRLLHESALNAGSKSPAEAWRRRLDLAPEELYPLMTTLHMYELASFDATFIELGMSIIWQDYLRASYRLQVAGEPRALVVAETLVGALKRAPQTMARHYRREAALGLRELLSRFDSQRVPASLMHYDRFSRMYRGTDIEETVSGLNAETELIRLPQIVHVASCASFHAPMSSLCDEERCAVAHGFDAIPYTDANEVVWLAAEIESKLEAGRAITEVWYDRLLHLAQACSLKRVRVWLVSSEGFSEDACEFLNEREAFGSSRQQLELLTARMKPEEEMAQAGNLQDEFEMVIPMGGDTELIAAHTVEQIARRLDFSPEAINQIKTALVEACINASEHSLSPDRKIYQRFRLESDRLIVTVSSRGLPAPASGASQNNGSAVNGEKGRRGWGLKLIRTLMDEVEFERVDDGTRLRMIKYLRH